MPCGRKAANSQKGGGFGKALGAHSKKYGNRTDYRKPDATKLEEVNQPDISDAFGQKNDQSVIEPTNLEDFLQFKLKQAQDNLVVYNNRSKKATSIQIVNRKNPVRRRDLPDDSSYTHHTIPLRPIRFTDVTSRILDFAITLGYFIYENLNVDLDHEADPNAENLDQESCDSSSSVESLSEEEKSESGDEDDAQSSAEHSDDSESIDDKIHSDSVQIESDGLARAIPTLPKRVATKTDDAEALRRATKVSDGRVFLEALVVHFTTIENCAPFMDKQAIAKAEERSFVEWRGRLEEERDRDHAISPFEKNINFWKELWHTIERSDLILEITDSRNPLLFHSPRLTEFVKKCRKEYILVLNKADFLTKVQRHEWKSYFENQGIVVVMYSALKEIQRNQNAAETKQSASSDDSVESDNSEEPNSASPGMDEEQDMPLDSSTAVRNVTDWEGVLSKEALLQMLEVAAENQATKRRKRTETAESFLRCWRQLIKTVQPSLIQKAYRLISQSLSQQLGSKLPDRSQQFQTDMMGFLFGAASLNDDSKQRNLNKPDFTAGTIGFPNVGKSSLINSLVGSAKRVAVSGTPGKTKHIQTLLIPGVPVQLCDCPGLVMPISNRSKEDLVINGIMSVDTYRGVLTSAIGHILRRIPEKLQVVFSISDEKIRELRNLLDKDVNQAGASLVDIVAGQRNYYAAGRGGQKDIIRSCRMIIKAYIGGGALVYCEKCPSSSQQLWTRESEITWRSQKKLFVKS